MNWFWLNIPLALLFFLAWTLIPLWMVIKHPDTGPSTAAPRRSHGLTPPEPVSYPASEPATPARELARRAWTSTAPDTAPPVWKGRNSTIMESLILWRPQPTGWHWLLGRLPSSYRELDAATDALSERVLDDDTIDVPADVRHLTEQVRWAVRQLR